MGETRPMFVKVKGKPMKVLSVKAYSLRRK